MKNNDLDGIKSVLMLASKLQNLCEGFYETNKSAVFSAKIKILLETSTNQNVTPSYLKSRVGLAKSNIAILCNKLISENLIEKSKDSFDTREITYKITEKGNEYLNNFLSISKKNFERQLAYKDNFENINNQVNILLDLVE